MHMESMKERKREREGEQESARKNARKQERKCGLALQNVPIFHTKFPYKILHYKSNDSSFWK